MIITLNKAYWARTCPCLFIMASMQLSQFTGKEMVRYLSGSPSLTTLVRVSQHGTGCPGSESVLLLLWPMKVSTTKTQYMGKSRRGGWTQYAPCALGKFI
jgi:hypothetical protein